MASSKLVTAFSLPAAEGRGSSGGLADVAGAAGGAARSRSRLLQVLVCACGQWTQHTSERPPPGSGCPPLSRSHPAFAHLIAIRDRPRQKHCVSTEAMRFSSRSCYGLFSFAVLLTKTLHIHLEHQLVQTRFDLV